MRALITEAYAETDKGKFKAAVNRLNEYTKTNAQLKQLFGFEFQLDHPLSFQALKDLKNVSPENLLRVNPIPAQLNRIKIGLDGTYRKIINNIRQGDSTPELLNQKQAIESLSTKLGVGEFKIDNTGKKVLSFGADPFLKTNLPEKMGQNIFLQDRIAKNLKNIEPELFTDALGKKSKFIKSIQNLQTMKPQKVKGLISFMKELGIKCQLSTGINCMNPKAYEKSLNELIVKSNAGDDAAKAKLLKFGNKVSKAGRLIRTSLGPVAIASEIALDVGLSLYDTMDKGVPIKQAFADSLTNKYILGPELQVDKQEEIKKELLEREMPDGTKIMLEDTPFNRQRGLEFAMAKRGETKAPFMAQSKEADKQRLKERQKQMDALYADELASKDLSNEEIDAVLAEEGVYSPYTLGFGMQQKKPGEGEMRYNKDVAYDELRDLFNQSVQDAIISKQFKNIADAGGVANLAGGGIAKLAGVDSGPPPEAGPNSRGLSSLMKRGTNT